MPAIDRELSALLLIDFQVKLMPAIEDATSVVANARRLLTAAGMFGVPVLLTEQNAPGLGPTIPELRHNGVSIAQKMTFDACRTPGFLGTLPHKPTLVVAGCEAHVCVLQTVLGLLAVGRRVFIVRARLGRVAQRARRRRFAVWSATGRKSLPPRW